MKTILWQIQSSARELKRTRVIAAAGMLIALSVLFSLFNIVLSEVLQISFSFLPIAAGGMLFGPVVGALMGVAGDILGYFAHSNGPFFPGFTLSALLSGAFYGFMLYGKPLTGKRVLAVSAVVALVVNLVLYSLWLSIMYGKAFVPLMGARALKNAVMLPVDAFMLYFILKIADRFRVQSRIRE